MRPLRFGDRAGETRRGQALLIAVVILSAIAIVGLGFATFITQSFETSERTSDIMRADALAREGLQWATRHLITSPEGADWRPLIQEGKNQGAIRMEDFDAQFDAFEQSKGWNLIDPHNGLFVKRKVGRGSFLVFVEYLSPGADYDPAPESHPELVGNAEAFEILNKLTIFHSKADNEHRGSLKIISIGRPADGETTYRRMDAYMPVPMVQHSRFITATATGLKETLDLEEGTILGESLVPFDGDGSLNTAESSASKLRLSGPIRFNTDVTWVGDSEAMVRSPNTLINPHDSDGLLVAGEISIPPNAMRPTWETLPEDTEPTWSFKSAPATLKILDEDTPINAKSSDDISVAADLIPLRGRPRLRDLSTGVVQSLKEGDLARFSEPFHQARYVQPLSSPSIDVKGEHGLERYRALTQYANLPVSLRGYEFVPGSSSAVRGIYIDNFADIQKNIPDLADQDKPLRQVIRDWREPPPLGNARRAYSSSARENPSGWAFNKWLDRNYPQTNSNDQELIGDSNPGDPSLYVPPGVEIVLTSTHTGVINGDVRESNLRYDGVVDNTDFPNNSSGLPDVVLIRHDGDLEGDPIREARSFRPITPTSSQQEAELRARPVSRLALDYVPLPPYGNAGAGDPNATLVIFAEGNVRIRGGGVDDDGDRLADEDPEEDGVDEDGDGKDGEDPIEDPRIATNLIVVSMGTIYIEGSLQTKNGAQIALMARDHICVNTTAMLPHLARIDVSDGDVELKEDVTGTWDPDEVNTHWEFERPGAANSVLRYQLPVSYLDGRNTWLQSGDGDGKAFWLTLRHSGVDNTDEIGGAQTEGQLVRLTPQPGCPLYPTPDGTYTFDPQEEPNPGGVPFGVHVGHGDPFEFVDPDDDEDKPWTLFRTWLTLKGPSGSYGDLYLLANPDDLAHRLFPDQPRDGFAFDQRHTTRYTKLPGRLHHPFSTRVVDVDWLGSLPNLENVQNLSPLHGVLNVQSPENREAGSNQKKTEYRFSRAKVERMQLLAGGSPDNPNHYRPSFVYPARIDAALFAQRGCFYVLPIPLFDSKPRDLAELYPGYPAGGTVGSAAIDDRWTTAAADPDEFTQRYVERFRHFNYFGWYDDTSDSRSSDDPSRYHGMILRGSITEFAPAQTFLRQIYPANAKLQAGVEDALDKLSYPVYDMNSGKIDGWRTIEFEFAPELAQNLRRIPLHDLGTWDPVLKEYDPVADGTFNGPGEFAWAPRLPYLPVSPDVIIGHVRR